MPASPTAITSDPDCGGEPVNGGAYTYTTRPLQHCRQRLGRQRAAALAAAATAGSCTCTTAAGGTSAAASCSAYTYTTRPLQHCRQRLASLQDLPATNCQAHTAPAVSLLSLQDLPLPP